MSPDKDGYRAGGGAGGSDRLPPASYFRPATGATTPPADAPTVQQPVVNATSPVVSGSSKATRPTSAPKPPASAKDAAPVTERTSLDGKASAHPAPPVSPPRAPDPAQGAPEGFDDDARTVLRPTSSVTRPAAGSPVVTRPPSPVSTKSPEELLSGPPSRRTRKARLRLSRIDPWSMMKTVFLFSIAGFIISMVAVGVLWTVIEASGLLSDLNEFMSTLVSTPSDPTPFDIHQYVNGPKVLGFTAVIGAIDIVLVTALGTLGAFLYNLSATMLGGLELTLAED